MNRFEGKRVLITGGTSGMGLAGAKMVAAEGGRVAVTGTSDEHLEEATKALPSDSLVLKNDASDPDAAKELGVKVKEHMGGIDALWLNAGFAKFGPADEIDKDHFRGMTDVNVMGPFLQMAELMPMISDGGAVVVTASISPYLGQPMGAVYASTKGAIRAASRSWAMDLADRNIRVNAIAPGPIETNFFEGMGLDEDKVEEMTDDIESQVPLGRFGNSEEPAHVALFLMSDHASYVTGSEYVVDGGMTLR